MSPYFAMCLMNYQFAMATAYLFATYGPIEAFGFLFALGFVP